MNQEMKKKLAHLLKKEGVLVPYSAILKSRMKSNYYIDVKKISGNPRVLRVISKNLLSIIPKEVNVIASDDGAGGIPLATTVSILSSKKLSVVRPGKKSYGTEKEIEGYMPTKGDIVAIVDDVRTTGDTLVKITNKVQKTGARVRGCYVVVDRGKTPPKISVEFKSLLITGDLK